jgi:hypothetical protein
MTPEQRSEKARSARRSRLDSEGRDPHSVATINKQHQKTNKEGKSLLAVSGATAYHSNRDELGRSVRTLERHLEVDRNGYSKLAKLANRSRMRPIEVVDTSTNTGFVFESISEAAKCFNVSAGNLRSVALGERKQTKGFIARFI